MASTPDATSVLNWIPQFFYDLIGRFVPGAGVLVSALLLFQDAAQAKARALSQVIEPEIPSLLLLLLGLLGCYLTGFLLGAIGFLFRFQEWRAAPPPLSLHQPPDFGEEAIRASFMYDAVQHHDPPAGARLAKLAAEQHMCRVLMAGFTILLILHVILHIIPHAGRDLLGSRSWALWQGIALSFVIASAWLSHRHLTIRSARLLSNTWYALGLAGKTRVDFNLFPW